MHKNLLKVQNGAEIKTFAKNWFKRCAGQFMKKGAETNPSLHPYDLQ
jgi:hypothetical protein